MGLRDEPALSTELSGASDPLVQTVSHQPFGKHCSDSHWRFVYDVLHLSCAQMCQILWDLHLRRSQTHVRL